MSRSMPFSNLMNSLPFSFNETEPVPMIDENDPVSIPMIVGKSTVASSQDAFANIKFSANDFIRKREKGGINTFSATFPLKGFFKNLLFVLDHLRDNVYDGQLPFQISMYNGDTAKLENSDLFLIINASHLEFYCHILGNIEDIKFFQDKIGKDETRVKMSWWFVSDDDGHFDERDLDFKFTQETEDEYYPNLPKGIDDYLKKFHESKSPILVLMGEPGTGKTSFIKNYIKEYHLNTVVTYDEKIMVSDYFYCQFLTDQKQQLLVIEDADVLLLSREKSDNKTMSKILNVSDGLVTLENKKIIFTTNLTQLNRIDEALIRPGRCFDVLNFEKLTYEQALDASKAAGVEPVVENREYTLSEIFNRTKHSYYTNRKIGF